MGQNTDINAESYADLFGAHVTNRTLPGQGKNPSDYSDVLKFSNAIDCLVDECDIYGGREDCIDINRFCRGITIQNSNLFPQEYGMTIKGCSSQITIKNITIHGNPTSGVDIDLGNFTEVSNGRTIGVTLENVKRSDGSPIIVRVLNADLPTVIGGNVKVIVPWYVKLKLFKAWWWLRKHGVFTS